MSEFNSLVQLAWTGEGKSGHLSATSATQPQSQYDFVPTKKSKRQIKQGLENQTVLPMK
jgi:hypothetical protein